MATFSFRCSKDPATHPIAVFDRSFPVGGAPTTLECPQCGSDAVRVFSPPMISRAHRGALALLDRAERSRTEPEVVTSPPATAAARPRSRSANPRWSRLPRP